MTNDSAALDVFFFAMAIACVVFLAGTGVTAWQAYLAPVVLGGISFLEWGRRRR